ncbi:MAG: hypothetical protein ABJM82_18945 [Shimia thalassica]|uniref:hypothetical protein n=1 Tax=Shimia thalassica TaxID=1715693 RepID=UPI00329770B6
MDREVTGALAGLGVQICAFHNTPSVSASLFDPVFGGDEGNALSRQISGFADAKGR